MIPDRMTERGALEARVAELEHRLAWLEQQLGERRPGPALVAAAEVDVFPVAADVAAEAAGDSDGGLEGARLVALELLSSGYGRNEVATYLRSTFGIADPESVIAGAGPAPG